MPSIRTLNLIWERKLRGAYPPSSRSLDNNGSLLLALPRPLEFRTFDLTSISLDGTSEIHSSFSVETLMKVQASLHSDTALGMTADDIYLFKNREKSRFLGEKRILFVDAAIDAEGKLIGVIYSDISGVNYTLSCGLSSGELSWCMDIDQTPTSIDITQNGKWIVIGSEEGIIECYDFLQRSIWRFGQDYPVSSIACSPNTGFTIYGSQSGKIGLLNSDGKQLWEAHLDGSVRHLAIAENGMLSAALCSVTASSLPDTLYFISDEGGIDWEEKNDAYFTGAAISPNAQYLAVSTKNARFSLFKTEWSEVNYHFNSQTELQRIEADKCTQDDKPEEALALLEKILLENPSDADTWSQMQTIRQSLLNQKLFSAQELINNGELDQAVSALMEAHHLAPGDGDILKRVTETQHLLAINYLSLSKKFLENLDYEEAEKNLRLAIISDPALIEARSLLATTRGQRAIQYDSHAEEMQSRKQLIDALNSLELAQEISPTPARGSKIQNVLYRMEFESGMQAYNAEQYQNAAYQFKKALKYKPDDADATRYLQYAQRFLHENASDSLGDRFRILD